MTVRAIVSKEIKFQPLNNGTVITFNVGETIEYERWKRPTDGEDVITIKYAFGEYSKYEYLDTDFDIENYVEEVPNLSKFAEASRQQVDRTYRPNQELPYIVQVEMRNSRIELNKYLKTIPGKNVIDIKPMENNCYLVIYKEIEK